MARAAASKSAAISGKSAAAGEKTLQRRVKLDRSVVSKERFHAVMQAAEQSGLLREKSGRIAGRVSRALIQKAKRQTGIQADTDLIEFALAAVALEDNFAEAFRASRGRIDPGLTLGF
jgi:hypothetical protein